MIHVAPCNRLGHSKHELAGTMCECGPEIHWDTYPAIVVHEFVPGDPECWGVFPEEEESEVK